jgi:hypothetical protein
MLHACSAAFALSLAAAASAQVCGQWADGFGYAAHGGRINDSIIFDDGTGPALYVAGSLDGIGAAVNAIAKWNGTQFVPVGGDVPGEGDALAIFDDDGVGPNPPSLFLTGSFQSAGGVAVNNIARWNGSSWSPLGSGLSGSGAALTIYDDGGGPGLIVGGYFTQAGGATANHLAMWRSGAWSQVGGGVTDTSDSFASANALAVFGGGLYVGGRFTTAGTLAVNALAKWQNGVWTRAATLSSAFSGVPVVQHLLPVNLPTTNGPALVVAGVFNGAMGSATIGAWNGTTFSPLGVTTNSSYSNPNGIGLYDPGTGPVLLASGHFNSPSGLLQWNGQTWDVLAPAQGDFYAGINTMTQTGPGALFVGGSVTQIQNLAVPNAAALDASGWHAMGTFSHGFDGSVYAIKTLDAGDGPHLYAAGSFRVADGQACGGIARRNGGAWVPIAASLVTTNELSGTIRDIITFDDGSGPALYAAGSFMTIDGVAAMNIARWRLESGWQPVGAGLNQFPSTTSVGMGVTALAIHDDHSGTGPALYAAGDIAYTGNTAGINHIARWSSAAWTPVGAGLGTGLDTPLAMATFDSDGAGPLQADLWVGGKNNLFKKWDGVSWTAPVPAPSGSTITSLFSFDGHGGPALYAGGSFNALTQTAVLRFDGQVWKSLGQRLAPTGSASSTFASIDDGAGPKLYAGGGFYDPFNYAVYNMAVLNGDTWTPIEGGLTGSQNGGYLNTGVFALAATNSDSGPQLWAGGLFSRYYIDGPDIVGSPSSNIAMVVLCRHCSSDFNGDGDYATDADIEAFFACIAGNCCATCGSADFDGDGDIATDADIEGFFRVLAGGAC